MNSSLLLLTWHFILLFKHNKLSRNAAIVQRPQVGEQRTAAAAGYSVAAGAWDQESQVELAPQALQAIGDAQVTESRMFEALQLEPSVLQRGHGQDGHGPHG